MISFLLPSLHIRAILDATTLGEMEDILKHLPSTLDDAFGETMNQVQKLPEPRRKLALKSLMWVLYSSAYCHLRLIDLIEALAVRENQDATDPKFRPSAEMIINCCRGLITINGYTSQPRFIHSAVQEYLFAHEDDFFADAQQYIATTCLTYLLTSTPMLRGSSNSEQDLREKINGAAFLWYAACRWGHHVQIQAVKNHTR